ncbi:hypothetical protein HanRHA438_Chr12g0571401 [Helianthus annuus]|nr:hypothetical protein HanHA300_Chr12g0459111 [Helianthus annuus]KAJ0495060.1 hypothetical protein HanIR_Chr12g0604641 [Helianthus annuus]KAJ0506668.1 hypothetical protein HanHA89_Chr12g0484721 [Helianthus annuus]KAJ0676342.1 hypothetical protein HanLR1_Chr12g0461691 [Helianthus annuus]KAJ0868153.1 hypothetical protein HanRHA438_Chr12g0571401 [Helianthus annuus]
MFKSGPSRIMDSFPKSGGADHVLKIEEKSVDVHVETSAFFFFQGRAVLGRVVDFQALIGLKEILKDVGCKIYYTGGFNLLLVFKEDYEAIEFLDNKDTWVRWFSHLDMWSGQSGAFERIAWLKIIGVPVHLAENKVFDDVAGKFGKVVHRSQLSEEDQDLSLNIVGVLVDGGFPISESVTLNWKNKRFKVWVREEERDWIPDFLDNDDWPESSSGDDDDKSSQLGSVRSMEVRREEEEKSHVHGEEEEGQGVNNGVGEHNLHEECSKVGGQQNFIFGNIEKVGRIKKKPFNILKDKHLPRP